MVFYVPLVALAIKYDKKTYKLSMSSFMIVCSSVATFSGTVIHL